MEKGSSFYRELRNFIDHWSCWSVLHKIAECKTEKDDSETIEGKKETVTEEAGREGITRESCWRTGW